MNIAPFAYLMAEITQYCLHYTPSIECIPERLAEFGYSVGSRMVDIVYAREKPQKRDIRLYDALGFLKSTFWKALFGKEADELERDRKNECLYYLIEREPVVNRFTQFHFDTSGSASSTPLNLASFNAGVVNAFLNCTGYNRLSPNVVANSSIDGFKHALDEVKDTLHQWDPTDRV